MNGPPTKDGPGPTRELPVVAIKWLALGFLAIKAFMIGTTPPFMDEVYYWLWGQWPALSYFDHPPLGAWLLNLSSLFGWNLFALRAPVILTLAGDIWVIYLFSGLLPPANRARYFWLTVLLFAATPIFVVMGSFAVPDHVLIFFTLLGLYCFARFLNDWQPDGPVRYRWLYAAGLCVGMATLAKYNGVLLGLGFAVFLLVSPRHRVLLGRWQTYATGLLAMVVMIPVLVWNIGNGFASIEFIARVRHEGLPGDFPLEGFAGFVASMIVFLSPFLIPALIRFLRAPAAPALGAGFCALGRVEVIVSTVVIGAVSLVTTILFHWNIVAFVGLVPFLAIVLAARGALIAHLIYSLVFIGIVYTNFALIPAATLAGTRDWSAEWSFGWTEVAERIKAAQESTGATLVAATHYGPASQIAFALQNRSVLRFGDRVDQFSFLPDGAVGQDVILVSDRWNRVTDKIRALFDSVTLIERVPVIRFGKQVNVQRIYFAKGYRGRE
ncbi:MAG: phospholipid carrier-dependent glycosyltransferase [Alphaproteobacteria bacterium]|nr:phospholipid carrier-dependent glycosyltransferase [Alphaproteobacteria bacterium]